MTTDEALALLGSDRGTDAATLRTRYRRLLRRHHPDVAGEAGSDRTALLTRAWAVIGDDIERSVPSSDQVPPPQDPPAPAPRAADRPDVVALSAPTRAVLDHLAEAADLLGHLSYIDRQNGILETVIRPDGGPSCSLMITVVQQGGDTLAACELESLEARPGPPIAEVVRALRQHFERIEARDR